MPIWSIVFTRNTVTDGYPTLAGTFSCLGLRCRSYRLVFMPRDHSESPVSHRMLTIQQCRVYLAETTNESLSDKEVETIRDHMYVLARLTVASLDKEEKELQ